MTMTYDGTNGITFPDSSQQKTAATGFGFKNRIINGAMMIDQRNAGASASISTGASTYTLDRWLTSQVSAGVYTIQQVSDAPAGFVNSLKATITTADASIAADDRATIWQRIEGLNVADLAWGTVNAQTVTMSFQVKSSLTGTFGGAIKNSAGDRSYPFTYTISSANTWETKSVTVTGDTTGTWLTTNGIGISLTFSLAAGSNWASTAGAWGSTAALGATGQTQILSTLNATWQVTGVQLEKGTAATSFDYRPYGTELALCQRYYETTATSGTIGLNEVSVQVVWNAAYCTAPQFKVTKRAAPTVTIYSRGNTAGQVSSTASGANVSAATATNISASSFWSIYLTTGQTAYSSGMEAGFTASAEL